MAVTISAYDSGIPLMDAIIRTHHGVAKESLSVAGNHLRVSARSAFISSQRTAWGFKNINGKRRLIHNSRYNKVMGQRYKRKSGQIDSPSNMANFITSYLMETSMKVVVGGKHKGGQVKRYVNGVPTGSIKIKGVSKKTFAILDRLNVGGVQKMSKAQQKILQNTSTMVLEKGKLVEKKFMTKYDFSEVKFKRRNYMAKGFMMARPKIQNSMTTRYENLLGKKVSGIRVKAVRVA